MKRIIVICLLVFFTIEGHAQISNKEKISELNQDQLNLALAKSVKKIKTAKILTYVGAVTGITGAVLLIDDKIKRDNQEGFLAGLPTDETGAGLLMLAGGVITEIIAITTWEKASTRKKNIEIELIKYNSKGSASINGIGLRIRF